MRKERKSPLLNGDTKFSNKAAQGNVNIAS